MLHQKVPHVNFLMSFPKFFPLSINKEHFTSLFTLIKLFIYENRKKFCPADNYDYQVFAGSGNYGVSADVLGEHKLKPLLGL